MKNMAFKCVGNIIIVVHNREPPENDAWNDYLEATLAAGRIYGNDLSNVRHLVVTEGGGPNSAQRKAVDTASQEMNGKNSPVAVISASPMIRGIVTVFNWFNLNMRVFSLQEADKAFQFIGVLPRDITKIWYEVKVLQAELGIKPFDRWPPER
jgi:hypothetical protein